MTPADPLPSSAPFIQTPDNKTMHPGTAAILLIATAIGCSSCANNEHLEQRMDNRNDAYSNYIDRREIRADARQERTDDWYDRHMH